MIDVNQVQALVPQTLFETTGHVPVDMRRLPGARLLWVNRRAMHKSTTYKALGEDAAAYDQHLLNACAFVIKPEGDTAPADALGYADRYGGDGIGRNGGSGRSAFVNGFHVKGVGRTPLVSVLTLPSHASGGAYLEESVRETIFSEIVGNEFPLGAVPTLAILDTGLNQQWGPGITPSRERRTLVIRPAFLRPAHFERATSFISNDPKEGARDTLRVKKMFEAATRHFGHEWLTGQYDRLWPGWARQLAYSFIHRLPPGSNTSSNIALDGRLVDFGAMTAVPSWATFATSLYPQSIQMQLGTLRSRLQSTAYFFGLHCNSSFSTALGIEKASQSMVFEFQRTLMLESLRLLGLEPDDATGVVESAGGTKVWHALNRVIHYFQGEYLDMSGATPIPRIEWDIAKVWQQHAPAHLRELSAILKDVVPTARHVQAQERCEDRAATRSHLFYPELKQAIYRQLEVEVDCSSEDAPARTTALIERYVALRT